MSARSSGYLWILGGGLLQVPAIEKARERGLNVIISDRNEGCVARAHLEADDRFLGVDIFDVSGHLQSLAALQAEGLNIRGVIAEGIDAPITASTIAAALGKPWPSVQASHLVHNKPLFRRFQAQHDLPRPEVHVATRETDLDRLMGLVTFPVIVKNSDSSASRGTRKLRSPDLDAFRTAVNEAIRVSRSGIALIEELMEGSEHTVETLFHRGTFHPCFITDRTFSDQTDYALEQGLMHPSLLSDKDAREMYDLVYRYGQLLGITDGPLKADMMLTARGPIPIEMTTRLSGGFDCQYVVPIATGKDIIGAAISIALGEELDPSLLQATRERFVATGSPWPRPGILERIEGTEEIQTMPGFERWFSRYEPGDEIPAYDNCANRVGFLLASGATPVEAREHLEAMLARLHFITVDASTEVPRG